MPTGKQPLTVGAKREKKHMSLINAKFKVRAAHDALQELLSDVRNAPPDDAKEKPEELTPNLVSVLNNTGNEISEIADQIVSLTSELRDNIL